MRLLPILTCFLIFGVSIPLKAQKLEPLEIIPFDNEQYEKKLRQQEQFDSLILTQDTLPMNIHNPYSMRIIDVPQNSMAKMPNMQIRQDVHYHMQIKKYENWFSPKSPELEDNLLPEQKDKSAEKPPEK